MPARAANGTVTRGWACHYRSLPPLYPVIHSTPRRMKARPPVCRTRAPCREGRRQQTAPQGPRAETTPQLPHHFPPPHLPGLGYTSPHPPDLGPGILRTWRDQTRGSSHIHAPELGPGQDRGSWLTVGLALATGNVPAATAPAPGILPSRTLSLAHPNVLHHPRTLPQAPFHPHATRKACSSPLSVAPAHTGPAQAPGHPGLSLLRLGHHGH